MTDVDGSDDDTPDTVEFTWVPLAGIVPQVIVEKADAWYRVYDWQTQVQSLGGNLNGSLGNSRRRSSATTARVA